MDLSMPPKSKERDWAALPWDALSLIFEKVGAAWILVSLQAVCRQWRLLALEPHVWRHINLNENDLYMVAEVTNRLDIEEMAVSAIKKSKGQVVSLYIAHAEIDKVMTTIAERARGLKQLHLVSCHSVRLLEEEWIEMFQNLSLLKGLEISDCKLSNKELEIVCNSCPMLESFQLNRVSAIVPFSHCNREAFAIAKTMPEIRELQIFGNRLDNVGLHVILDACPNLKSLDLRQCYQLNFDDDLKKKCNRLKILRLPNDSTDDYPYLTEYGHVPYDYEEE